MNRYIPHMYILDYSDYFIDEFTFCLFFHDFAVVNNQTSLKTLTINKETTKELSMTSMSYTTMLTQTKSAGNINA